MRTRTNPARRITRHISFTLEENEMLQKRASAVGMEIAPFIKQQALHGTAKGFRLTPLTQHTITIAEIAQDIRNAVHTPHPDRWLYQADLEAIEDKLEELLQIESTILERVRRRLI